MHSTKKLFLVFALQATVCQADERSGTVRETVLRKLYPKAGRLDLGIDVGGIINQSFVQTNLLRLQVDYHWSERWGIGVSLSTAANRDKEERACLETFYNDPDEDMAAECAFADDGAALATTARGNLGPAYMDIRERGETALLHVVWSPIYGKQILLQEATSYFDIQIFAGLGLDRSRLFPEQTHARGQPHRPLRGTFVDGEDPPGVNQDEGDSRGLFHGRAGRPSGIVEINPLLRLGVQQKFFLASRYFLSMGIYDDLLFTRSARVESSLAIQAGIGARL